MKINLNDIFEGWANVVKDKFDALDPSLKEQATLRLEHCTKCYMRTGNICDSDKVGLNIQTNIKTKGCGCNLSAKTLSPCSKCPLGIWDKMNECS